MGKTSAVCAKDVLIIFQSFPKDVIRVSKNSSQKVNPIVQKHRFKDLKVQETTDYIDRKRIQEAENGLNKQLCRSIKVICLEIEAFQPIKLRRHQRVEVDSNRPDVSNLQISKQVTHRSGSGKHRITLLARQTQKHPQTRSGCIYVTYRRQSRGRVDYTYSGTKKNASPDICVRTTAARAVALERAEGWTWGQRARRALGLGQRGSVCYVCCTERTRYARRAWWTLLAATGSSPRKVVTSRN